MAMLREGDVLVVTKLDRLARSMADLMKILEAIKAAGATLRVLAMGLDTGNATSKLILNVLGSVAEFERELMLERQRAGIAKAKAEGKGGKRTFSDELLRQGIRHERFLDFITGKPRSGCGWEPDKVARLLHDDAEVLSIWREVVTLPHGINQYTMDEGITTFPWFQ
jgi:DNA invertase Pin-like site-specific DNA recombinase